MCQEDDCRDCGGGCHCDKDEEIKELEAQLAEAKRDMREVTCDARETYEEMSKQLAEARKRIEDLESTIENTAI